MYYSGLFKPIVPLLSQTGYTWQNALYHYQRSLVECGSSLELEHAQRIALLFLKKSEGSKQLNSWAKLFSSEDVPTCALMLKALVKHDLWKTAINIWKWSPNDALIETLVDELMTKNLWKESLNVVLYFLSNECEKINFKKDKEIFNLNKIKNIDNDIVLALNDAIRLVNDPTFIPIEEQRTQSGLQHLVNIIYPKKSQWQEAISLLIKLSRRGVSSGTRKEILNYAAARCAYHGEKYNETFDWIKNSEYFNHSKSLQRIFFRLAVLNKSIEDALNVLEVLIKQGLSEIPTVTLQLFCKQFINEYERGKYVELLDRFSIVISKCSSRIYCKKTREELKQFFKNNFIDTTSLDVVNLLEGSRGVNFFLDDKQFSQSYLRSVTDIDHAATTLLKNGNWKASLELLKKLVETEPINENEKVLLEAARSSIGNWETAILFFA